MTGSGRSHIVFHPYFNHFPIAFFILEAFLIGLWIWKKEERYERFSYFILKLAMFFMPWVMLTGTVDAGGIVPMVRPHFFMAVALFSLGGIRFLIRWRLGAGIWQGAFGGFYLVLVVLNVLLTTVTGHFGGMLVYS